MVEVDDGEAGEAGGEPEGGVAAVAAPSRSVAAAGPPASPAAASARREVRRTWVGPHVLGERLSLQAVAASCRSRSWARWASAMNGVGPMLTSPDGTKVSWATALPSRITAIRKRTERFSETSTVSRQTERSRGPRLLLGELLDVGAEVLVRAGFVACSRMSSTNACACLGGSAPTVSDRPNSAGSWVAAGMTNVRVSALVNPVR